MLQLRGLGNFSGGEGAVMAAALDDDDPVNVAAAVTVPSYNDAVQCDRVACGVMTGVCFNVCSGVGLRSMRMPVRRGVFFGRVLGGMGSVWQSDAGQEDGGG
jgi:hypothetical protein